ncbi:MAG: hypothetical protein ISR58_01440 [Anaerolineales bacterium]|nr:hypothetical protein [Chloroflexota bacterium]MBL6979829.1 hypothetical protein [Anaerolineales bacterium]
MNHPFSSILRERRGRYFWPLVVFTVLIMLTLNLAGIPLTTDAAPAGIVSYEFAGNVTGAEKILASWDNVARERAAFVQGLDFLFIPFYAGAIALGCLMALGVLLDRGWGLASVGVPLAWLVFLAGLLDVVENIALVVMLFDMPANPWPQIAYWCAAPKFIFVVLGILYSVLGAVVHLFVRKK